MTLGNLTSFVLELLLGLGGLLCFVLNCSAFEFIVCFDCMAQA